MAIFFAVVGGLVLVGGVWVFISLAAHMDHVADFGRWSNRWTEAEWNAWILNQYKSGIMRETSAKMNKFREQMSNKKINLGGSPQ